MSFNEVVEKRMEVEKRMAQWKEESNKVGSVGRKVQERMGRAGSGGDNSEICRLQGAWYMTMGRTDSEVYGKR